jgi:hypothetical protein
MWYYVGPDRVTVGPVAEGHFRGLIATNVVKPNTLVWTDGMAQWLPLSAVPLTQPRSLPVLSGEMATCQFCNRPFGVNNLVEIAGVRTCAECKPLAVQSLSEGGAPIGGSIWREGKKVVVLDGTRFPARCVKCNEPTNTPPLVRRLYWHTAWIYLLLFVSVLIYVVVAIIIRKRATVEYHLCPAHLARRRNFVIGVWACLLLTIGCFVLAIAESQSWLAGVALLLLIVSLVLGMFGVRALATVKIDNGTVWMTGAGKAFLDSLPDWVR